MLHLLKTEEDVFEVFQVYCIIDHLPVKEGFVGGVL